MISVEVAKLLVSLASPQLNDIDSRRCIGLYDAVPLFGNEDVPCDEMHVRQLIGQIYHILLKLLPSRHLYRSKPRPQHRSQYLPKRLGLSQQTAFCPQKAMLAGIDHDCNFCINSSLCKVKE